MVDVITLELVRESLISIVQEMRINLTRTAYSSILYEGEDFSCVIMSPESEIVAMSKGRDHHIHVFPIAVSMKTIKDRFADEEVKPGDVFLHNDTYTGGTHLNDIAMVYPVFLNGKPFLYPVVRAHWADVGGMTYGSISGQASEVYQEGVRIPPIRIFDGGVYNDAAQELIFANMRIRREREGDFRAMLGTCRMAEARIKDVVDRFGIDVITESIDQLMERNERRMRQAISQLPQGEYYHETYMESGKVDLEPRRVFLKMTVEQDSIKADFDGSSPQSNGPNNVGPGLLPSGVFAITKSFLDPDADINHGSLRPITVTAPVGTVTNCRLPAPCGGSAEVTFTMGAAALGAIAPALNGKVIGDIKGGANHLYVGGINPRTEEHFVFYEYPAGGVGAFEGHDGNNSVRSYFESDITPLQPIEAVEQKYPMLVEHFGLREDSGGDGKWRGGIGVRRAVRLFANDAQYSVVSDHNIIPPYGVCGGDPGSPNRFTVIRDGVEVVPPSLPGKISGYMLKYNDIILMQSSGGGGFGEPLDRDPMAVVDDVSEGYISAHKAESVYGVVIHEGLFKPDRTDRLRQFMRSKRTMVSINSWQDEEYYAGGRICYLNSSAMTLLELREGDMVEIDNPSGMPLRGWVKCNPDSNTDNPECYIGPIGKKILRVSDGEMVRIRHLNPKPEDVSRTITPYTVHYQQHAI